MNATDHQVASKVEYAAAVLANYGHRAERNVCIEAAKRLREMAAGDKVRGHLKVGINDDGEVVINFDRDRVGHIVFSPQQARDLASLLTKKASEGDEVQGLLRN